MAGSVLQGVTAVQSAYVQSEAQKAQGEYTKRTSDLNARQMENEAKQVETKAGRDVAKRRQETRKLEGAQKAALAAAGVDVGSEQALDTFAETAAIGAADEAAITTNAWRNVWGIQSEADMTRTRGDMAKRASKYAARQTMITGALTGVTHLANGVQSTASGKGGT